MAIDLVQSFVELKNDEVLEEVNGRINNGISPMKILDECRQGVIKVGELFQKKEYFLAELMLSGELLSKVIKVLEPLMAKTRPAEPVGKVVLVTLKGDIHDLGKNIFSILLTANGFKVYDLGVDQDPKKVVEEIKKIRPDIVGFSALISTAFDSMKEAAKLLEQAGLRKSIELMIGGGITTAEVKKFVGADFQTLDAMDGVGHCMKIIKERKVKMK